MRRRKETERFSLLARCWLLLWVTWDWWVYVRRLKNTSTGPITGSIGPGGQKSRKPNSLVFKSCHSLPEAGEHYSGAENTVRPGKAGAVINRKAKTSYEMPGIAATVPLRGFQ